MPAATVHLHWLYESIPLKDAIAALRETSSGFALCGEAKLPNKQLTIFPDDATCKKCLGKVDGRLAPRRVAVQGK